MKAVLTRFYPLFLTVKGRVLVGICAMTIVVSCGALVLARPWENIGAKVSTNTPSKEQRAAENDVQINQETTTETPPTAAGQSQANNTQTAPVVPQPSGGTSSTPPASPAAGGSTGSTTPPPQTGGCSGAAWEPDGPDPWGGCWPGPSSTGVPSGVALTNYSGPCTITVANTVIDAKTVNCILSIQASNVVITRSQINGGVDVPSAAPSGASFSISDSSILIGDNLNTGLMRRNFTANRVDIMGGRRSVYCVTNCVVENSWVHAQGGDPNGAAHFSGLRMEQYTTYRHNSITCEATRVPGSGCSAGLTGYGDFAPIQNNLIERNLFYKGGNGGSTACAYGGSSGDDGSKPFGNQAMNIRFISNRFVRSENGLCGNLRTIIDFNPSRPGNIWTDNLYHDGAVISSTGP